MIAHQLPTCRHLASRSIALALGLLALACTSNSFAQIGPLTPPSANMPLDASKLKVPPAGMNLPLGALTVTKAEARVFPAGVSWVPAGKVGVDVAYCVRNTGESNVAGPIYVKFYWAGISDSNDVSQVPGMQGSLYGPMLPSMAAKSDQCGNIKVTFDSPAFAQLAPLQKAPKLRAWVPFKVVGNSAAPAPQIIYANNPRPVTVVPAAPQ